MSTMKCARCGTDIEADYKYCEECGAAAVNVCLLCNINCYALIYAIGSTAYSLPGDQPRTQ